MIANIMTILYILSISNESINNRTLQKDDINLDLNVGFEVIPFKEENIYLISEKFCTAEDGSINVNIITNVHIPLDKEDSPIMKPTELYCEILEFQFVSAKVEMDNTISVPWKSKTNSNVEATSSSSKSPIGRIHHKNIEYISKSLLSQDNQIEIHDSDQEKINDDDEVIEDNYENIKNNEENVENNEENIKEIKLSKNYIEILDDDEYYDITIEVGNDPNVKIFRAHMIILCYRSPFLRRTLASSKKDKNNVLTHIKFPNILPEIFQIILKYIYGGIISLNEQKTSEILKILAAADQLHLQELVDYLQKFLIENKSEWMEQNFEFTYQTSFQSNSLLELQQFCTDFMFKSPEKIFKSINFTSLPEKLLISLIKKDDLQMKESEIWEHILKWGLAQNPTLISDPISWTDDDFKTMENTLQHCLPLIRFYSLSSEEFVQKVRPYKKLLKPQFYEELLIADPHVIDRTDI
ncbi:hypothetical protein C1645_878753, partial [Glomus cerebriforme]